MGILSARVWLFLVRLVVRMQETFIGLSGVLRGKTWTV